MTSFLLFCQCSSKTFIGMSNVSFLKRWYLEKSSSQRTDINFAILCYFCLLFVLVLTDSILATRTVSLLYLGKNHPRANECSQFYITPTSSSDENKTPHIIQAKLAPTSTMFTMTTPRTIILSKEQKNIFWNYFWINICKPHALTYKLEDQQRKFNKQHFYKVAAKIKSHEKIHSLYYNKAQ